MLSVFHCNYFIRRELKRKKTKTPNLQNKQSCVFALFISFFYDTQRQTENFKLIFLSFAFIGKYKQPGFTASKWHREREKERQNIAVDHLINSAFNVE